MPVNETLMHVNYLLPYSHSDGNGTLVVFWKSASVTAFKTQCSYPVILCSALHCQLLAWYALQWTPSVHQGEEWADPPRAKIHVLFLHIELHDGWGRRGLCFKPPKFFFFLNGHKASIRVFKMCKSANLRVLNCKYAGVHWILVARRQWESASNCKACMAYDEISQHCGAKLESKTH